MIHRILRLVFVFTLFVLGTQYSVAQRKNKKSKNKHTTEVVTTPRDTIATYQGDFKEDFLRAFFKESGKIVFNGAEFKFVLSLLLTDTGEVNEVIVLGVDNSNVKERMKTIAMSVGTWNPEVKEGKHVKSQVTIPFVIKQSDFIMTPADLNKLLEKNKE